MEETFYYCPNCLILFLQDSYYRKVKSKFECRICKDLFTSDSYSDTKVTNGGHPYKIHKLLSENDIHRYIDTFIHNLFNDGYSHRDIKKITRFSNDMVRKSLKRIDARDEDDIVLNKKQFLFNKLKVIQNDWVKYSDRKNIEVANLNNFEKYILNAYNFGCTYNQIQILFKVSSKTVVAIIDRNQDKVKLVCNHKIKIEKAKVRIIHKKTRRKKRNTPTLK